MTTPAPTPNAAAIPAAPIFNMPIPKTVQITKILTSSIIQALVAGNPATVTTVNGYPRGVVASVDGLSFMLVWETDPNLPIQMKYDIKTIPSGATVAGKAIFLGAVSIATLLVPQAIYGDPVG